MIINNEFLKSNLEEEVSISYGKLKGCIYKTKRFVVLCLVDSIVLRCLDKYTLNIFEIYTIDVFVFKKQIMY